MAEAGERFEKLVAIMARLRAPGGCPWDRKQTFETIQPYTVEETYEVLQAIEDRDWPGLKEELGDLLLQILFYAEMAEENGSFDIAGVLAGLESKLIRRHPHVFGAEQGTLGSAEAVAGRWEEIKRQEREEARAGVSGAPESGSSGGAGALPASAPSALGELPRGLPPLAAAHQVSVRAARAGFEWPDAAAVLAKLEEEIAELRYALLAPPGGEGEASDADAGDTWRHEVGDLLFATVNVARRLGLTPDAALQTATRKFPRRFQAVEQRVRAAGTELSALTAAELDAEWEAVKAEESGPRGPHAAPASSPARSAAAESAPRSGARAELPIRALRSLAEFQACVALQRRVWGFDAADLVPVRMFVVAHKIGGQVFGAFDGQTLAGYCLALPGDRNGHAYLHSHMLAVAPEYRDHGVGRGLKLRQREDGMARGFALMEWTFDPLEIKNAYFNLERLGAIARRYVPNQYGVTSSRLHAGLPTDRLVAEWWFTSRRVTRVLAAGAPGASTGEPRRRPEPPQAAAGDASAGAEAQVRVAVPAEITAWKHAGDPRAAQAQTRIREELTAAFAAGLAALSYERHPDGGGAYCLSRWDEDLTYGPPRFEAVAISS
ncbi:MAG: nucleoside triphosphate pyrophosphohydrolase [Terriglobales bacterium]